MYAFCRHICCGVRFGAFGHSTYINSTYIGSTYSLLSNPHLHTGAAAWTVSGRCFLRLSPQQGVLPPLRDDAVYLLVQVSHLRCRLRRPLVLQQSLECLGDAHLSDHLLVEGQPEAHLHQCGQLEHRLLLHCGFDPVLQHAHAPHAAEVRPALVRELGGDHLHAQGAVLDLLHARHEDHELLQPAGRTDLALSVQHAQQRHLLVVQQSALLFQLVRQMSIQQQSRHLQSPIEHNGCGLGLVLSQTVRLRLEH
mmetsp:Transcript_23710/g.52690  ORF Transcript_23710/g.52690 Transcript_23710/m.52690 type:complete len:252 (+) Transcript_23710:1359-2114(+)